MPLYQYRCPLCGDIEKLMKISESEVKTIKCDCGQPAKRIPSSGSFELKGGGWAGSGYTKGD